MPCFGYIVKKGTLRTLYQIVYSTINFDCLEWILKKVLSQAYGIKVGGDICTVQHCNSENFESHTFFVDGMHISELIF